MLPSSNKHLTKFFYRFAATNFTIFIILQEYQTISGYVTQDFSYQIMGPYMARNNVGLQQSNCQKFYDQQEYFTRYLFTYVTNKEYMVIIKSQVKQHGQLLEVILTIAVVGFSFFVEILGFYYENDVLNYIDNILTWLLPHFTLMMNAMTWGDQCIQQASILNFISFTILAYVGQFTFGSICVVMVLYGIIQASGLFKYWYFSILFCFVVSLEIIYIITIDFAVIIWNNTPIQSVLFIFKLIILFLSQF